MVLDDAGPFSPASSSPFPFVILSFLPLEVWQTSFFKLWNGFDAEKPAFLFYSR